MSAQQVPLLMNKALSLEGIEEVHIPPSMIVEEIEKRWNRQKEKDILYLPSELWENIVSFCPLDSYLNLAVVNGYLKGILSNTRFLNMYISLVGTTTKDIQSSYCLIESMLWGYAITGVMYHPKTPLSNFNCDYVTCTYPREAPMTSLVLYSPHHTYDTFNMINSCLVGRYRRGEKEGEWKLYTFPNNFRHRTIEDIEFDAVSNHLWSLFYEEGLPTKCIWYSSDITWTGRVNSYGPIGTWTGNRADKSIGNIVFSENRSSFNPLVHLISCMIKLGRGFTYEEFFDGVELTQTITKNGKEMQSCKYKFLHQSKIRTGLWKTCFYDYVNVDIITGTINLRGSPTCTIESLQFYPHSRQLTDCQVH